MSDSVEIDQQRQAFVDCPVTETGIPQAPGATLASWRQRRLSALTVAALLFVAIFALTTMAQRKSPAEASPRPAGKDFRLPSRQYGLDLSGKLYCTRAEKVNCRNDATGFVTKGTRNLGPLKCVGSDCSKPMPFRLDPLAGRVYILEAGTYLVRVQVAVRPLNASSLLQPVSVALTVEGSSVAQCKSLVDCFVAPVLQLRAGQWLTVALFERNLALSIHATPDSTVLQLTRIGD